MTLQVSCPETAIFDRVENNCDKGKILRGSKKHWWRTCLDEKLRVNLVCPEIRRFVLGVTKGKHCRELNCTVSPEFGRANEPKTAAFTIL